jgi:hypothetical protein
MNRLLAVAARELRERWILFPAALVIGVFPLVLPAFGVPRDAPPTVGLFGAVTLGAAAGIIIGSSMLARDAANGRLGFLFSRPVAWPAIWGGKWLAALVLVVASGFLAAIPWMAAFPLASLGGHHGDSWFRAMLDGPGAVLFFILIVLAIGFANFGATAFRSRSPWVALDLVLLLAAFWAIRRYVAPLWWYGVLDWGGWSPALSLLPLALGLGLGSVAQVAVGRTDLRRAHRALSLGFWAVIALTLAAAAGYWAWIRSTGPADVRTEAVTRDPAGRWVYVEGRGRRHAGWYPHGFLIDTTNGRYAVRPDPRWDRGEPPLGLLFSADGRFAALPGRDRDDRGAAVDLFDLTGETPRLSQVALESSPPPTWQTSFALSPSAASVFVAHESGASLFTLPSGRRVATTTIGPGWRPGAVRFLGEGTARAWLIPASEASGAWRPRAEMRVVDLATDRTSRTVTFPIAAPLPAGSWGAVVPDADGGRIVTVDAGVHLRDGAAGVPLATLAEGGGHSSVLFLADGRIVVGGGPGGAEPGPPRALVRVFDRAGVPLGEMRLDLWPGGLSVGPEVAPGRVAVSSFRSPYLAEDALLVDVGEGRVVERLSGLRPAIGFWNVSSVPADAGPTSVHFFRDVEGRVVRIDFSTGERKVVAGPGAPPAERISAR